MLKTGQTNKHTGLTASRLYVCCCLLFHVSRYWVLPTSLSLAESLVSSSALPSGTLCGHSTTLCPALPPSPGPGLMHHRPSRWSASPGHRAAARARDQGHTGHPRPCPWPVSAPRAGRRLRKTRPPPATRRLSPRTAATPGDGEAAVVPQIGAEHRRMRQPRGLSGAAGDPAEAARQSAVGRQGALTDPSFAQSLVALGLRPPTSRQQPEGEEDVSPSRHPAMGTTSSNDSQAENREDLPLWLPAARPSAP